jgi:predicted DNA-binding transcriptional regulator AlpA
MKILIIDDNGVKEFIPSTPNQEDQTKTNSFLNSFKESLLKNTALPVQSEISLYTISKLVTLFDTTRPTIYSWIEKGLLKPIKLGGRVYFNHKDIEALLESSSDL